MTQMTTGKARVVDPILTTHSRGYRTPGILRVGNILFPRAEIAKRGAKIILFVKKRFVNTVRFALRVRQPSVFRSVIARIRSRWYSMRWKV